MSTGVNLRDYQEGILKRLKLASEKESDVRSSYLGVVIGDKKVLVNLLEISETLPMLNLRAVPLTKSWFLGIANVRGNLYSVNDLAQLIGESPTNLSSSTRLMLVNNNLSNNVGLVVDRLIGLRSTVDMEVKKLKQASAFCMKPFEYIDSASDVWLELDCYQLIKSVDFINPSY